MQQQLEIMRAQHARQLLNVQQETTRELEGARLAHEARAQALRERLAVETGLGEQQHQARSVRCRSPSDSRPIDSKPRLEARATLLGVPCRVMLGLHCLVEEV